MGQIKTFFGTLFIGLFITCPTSWAGSGAATVTGAEVAPAPYPDLELTLVQIIDHVETHVERMKKLALVALNEFGSLYKGITPELALEFLSLHDKSKIDNSPKFYAEVNYHNEVSIPERLRRLFGKATDAQGNLKPEAKALFNEFNRMDKWVRYQFFVQHGMLYSDGTLRPIAKRLLKLEKVTDEVDRELHPISEFEFGRPMVRVGDYVPKDIEIKNSYEPLDDEQIAVARVLEKRYGEPSFPHTFTLRQCETILTRTRRDSQRIH